MKLICSAAAALAAMAGTAFAQSLPTGGGAPSLTMTSMPSMPTMPSPGAGLPQIGGLSMPAGAPTMGSAPAIGEPPAGPPLGFGVAPPKMPIGALSFGGGAMGNAPPMGVPSLNVSGMGGGLLPTVASAPSNPIFRPSR